MEENNEIENIEEFENLQEMEETEFNIDNLQIVEGEPLNCPFCNWKTHANAKDKKRGLKNHIKKCPHNPKNSISENPPPEKTKKVKIDILPPKIEENIDEFEMTGLSRDEQKDKLLGDLDILKIKFESIPFNWNYNINSSVQHLKRQKSLFMRVLNDDMGTRAMFKLLVIGSKAIEKVADVSNTLDLEGYSEDVNQSEQEIYPILKNLVDTGVLSVGHLTPELRLGMIMTSLAISRVEKNKIKKSSFLEEKEDESNWL